ncbi:SAM-dependent methyltransferase [Rugosimonospora africana]|uniref:SAM-dependent methyltransferase n=1 Tax=Rugosimonospora africana TaxID=556532 RepID=A0A8J3QRV7_9ACTN|nr:SAM-dependent methyltransferase [Rugosimonospora africana]GIH14722.1 SAM-dependent methyltransferase [Rugosimonospora africana]
MVSDIPAPPGVDITRPSVARVYDYMLGGKDNFAVDRQAAEAALRITPDGPEAARANRAFLGRVVHHLVAEAGIRQFLDIGSGLPTQGNVHQIAQRVAADAHVVYVDSDPMVLAHGRALLADNRTTAVANADVRQPRSILDHPDVHGLIDFDQPVGLLLLGILHHLADDEKPGDIAASLYAGLAPGSYVAISHFHDPGEAHPEESRSAREVERIFNQTMGTGRWRTHDEILAYFAGLELVEPGIVPMAEWRPEPGTAPGPRNSIHHTLIGGLARKP